MNGVKRFVGWIEFQFCNNHLENIKHRTIHCTSLVTRSHPSFISRVFFSCLSSATSHPFPQLLLYYFPREEGMLNLTLSFPPYLHLSTFYPLSSSIIYLSTLIFLPVLLPFLLFSAIFPSAKGHSFLFFLHLMVFPLFIFRWFYSFAVNVTRSFATLYFSFLLVFPPSAVSFEKNRGSPFSIVYVGKRRVASFALMHRRVTVVALRDRSGARRSRKKEKQGKPRSR